MKLRLSIICLFLVVWGFSQKSSASKSNLKIGEQTEIIYELPVNEDEGQISYIPYFKTIPCFRKHKNGSIDSTSKIELEIIKNFKDSIVYVSGNQRKWIGTYTVTAWDTGVLVLPPIKLSTQKQVYTFNSVILRISAPKIDKSKDIYDIREEFTDVDDADRNWLLANWYYLLGGLFLLVIVYLLWKKYGRKQATIQPEIKLSLRERTLLKIEGLEQQKLWEHEKYKEHYIEFSLIIRTYLSEKYQVNLLEKTSYESILLLRQKNLHHETLMRVQEMLNYADMIKFAKSEADEQTVKMQLNRFKLMVQDTDQEHVD